MIDRYSRLLELSSFSKEKLSLLKSKNILIVGVGGVGQNIATYLVTNGCEKLTIMDFDKVEISNLNRQYLVSEEDIGQIKVIAVQKALMKKNKDAKIKVLGAKITHENASNFIKGFDFIIDATDNWESKLVISNACHKCEITLLHIGVDGYSGQYALLKNKSLENLFSSEIKKEKRDGVLGPMVSLISSLAALLLISYIVGEQKETDILYSFDYHSSRLVEMKI